MNLPERTTPRPTTPRTMMGNTKREEGMTDIDARDATIAKLTAALKCPCGATWDGATWGASEITYPGHVHWLRWLYDQQFASNRAALAAADGGSGA